jgi:hypothetical protein
MVTDRIRPGAGRSRNNKPACTSMPRLHHPRMGALLNIRLTSFSAPLAPPAVMTTIYAVNNRARGKVHRVTAETARLPPHQQRVACGWHLKRSTSIVYYARRLKWGTCCLKCFPPKAEQKVSAPPAEEDGRIEQLHCEASATDSAP